LVLLVVGVLVGADFHSFVALVVSDRSCPAVAELEVAADPRQVAATRVTAVTVRILRAEVMGV
jgi:hypothetical protein